MGRRHNIGQYWEYAKQTTEENPLYLFDKKFGESVPQLVNDYAKPGCMEDDLFSLLGVEDRPDYRWLIIGAPRSGSTFHIDPNGQCIPRHYDSYIFVTHTC